jgi:hypothetical protein
MKLLSLALAVILVAATSARAQIIAENGSTFAPGSVDIANIPGYNSGYDGGQDFTDNNPVPGQTFTTLGNSLGYVLNSITLQNQGSGNGFQTDTFALGIYSVSGTTLTYLGGGSFSYSAADQIAGGTPTADYFTLNLATRIDLAPNTEYAFTYNRSSGGGYLGLDGGYPTDNSYAGGTAITATLGSYPSDLSGGTITVPNGTPYDRHFDVGLAAVPEPSTYALLLGGLAVLGFSLRRKRATLRA